MAVPCCQHTYRDLTVHCGFNWLATSQLGMQQNAANDIMTKPDKMLWTTYLRTWMVWRCKRLAAICQLPMKAQGHPGPVSSSLGVEDGLQDWKSHETIRHLMFPAKWCAVLLWHAKVSSGQLIGFEHWNVPVGRCSCLISYIYGTSTSFLLHC